MKKFNEYKGKKVVVTGGLGFIGSNLARRLLEAGAHVCLIDNLDPSCGGNLFNIADIKNKLDIKLLDITRREGLNALFDNTDYIFHLAAQTSHLGSMTMPLLDLEINAKVTLSILEELRRQNAKTHIIYASTRQIYGKTKYLPVDEAHPIDPIDINGIHKFASEQYLELYYKHYHIPCTILRLTNVFGPGLRIRDAKQMFMGIWIRNIIENKTFEVWGGNQLRDLIFVEDVVSAMLLSGVENKAIGQIYNVGGGKPCSLVELAQILIESAAQGNYTIMEYPSERKSIEIGDIYLDNTKIKKDLAWQPSVDLKEALQRTMVYYKKHFSSYI